MAETLVGGLSEKKPADDEVRSICASVKEAAQAKSGVNYDLFEAIAYKSQLVNGMNYFIKVKVSCEGYIELRVFKPFGEDGKPEFVDLLGNLNEDSEIVYFP